MIRVLVIDDEKGVGDFLSIMLRKEGYEAQFIQNPTQALKVIEEWGPQIILLDIRMPELDGLSLLPQIKELIPSSVVILMTAYASVESAIEAIRRGAFDYITKPFELEEMKLVLKRATEICKLREENIKLTQTIRGLKISDQLIWTSKAFQDLMELVQKVAITNSIVLIQGESGTGKELIAHELHKLSTRSDKPFIPINCGALPETLLESELFGYVKGAFTGAIKDKEGLFKSAHKGTLFLDEISTASQKIQVGLLRAVEQKEIMPIGANSPIPVDVRLIVATNQDLEKLILEGKFREDLYYRINVILIQIPPLRERKEDIPTLTHYFLNKYCTKHKVTIKRFSATAMDLLLSYSWPGNVRELENVIEREVIMEENTIIEIDALPDKIKESVPHQTIRLSAHQTIRLSARQHQILQYLNSHTTITSKICASMFEISHRMARNDLTDLVSKKLLSRQGTAKKNTYYTLNQEEKLRIKL